MGDILAIQSYAVLGSNCLPIPGSIGVTDYLMLDGFSSLLSAQDATNLELLSRSVSFYTCIILCGVAVLIKYACQKMRGKSS